MPVMTSSFWRPPVVAVTLAAALLAGVTPLHASEDSADQRWQALRAESRQALSTLVQPWTPPVGIVADVPEHRAPAQPRMIVIGFTGGLEGENSRVSGVVRLRRKIDEQAGAAHGVVALAYSNFSWRRAAEEVVALSQPAAGEMAGAAHRTATAGVVTQPLIVVYGHSWGGGAITKFARALRERRLEVGLAVYVDAFTLRTPRVPDNVRYAVNVYQRTGIFRGLPLRGKRTLTPEAPESTVVLANLRITPDTAHFGWNWNLVQPLLYRHHHRIGHDVRIQNYLLDLIAADLDGDQPGQSGV